MRQWQQNADRRKGQKKRYNDNDGDQEQMKKTP